MATVNPVPRKGTAPATKPATKPTDTRFGEFTIMRKAPEMPIHMLLYGLEGLGKSSFCAQFPDPVFILAREEQGILSLMAKDLVDSDTAVIGPKPDSSQWQLKTFNDLLKVTEKAIHFPNKTIVFESMSAFEVFPYPEAMAEHCEGKEKLFYSYATGPRACEKFYWPKWMDLVNNLLAAGKNVIMTAHAKPRPTNDPVSGVAFDRWELRLDRGFQDILTRWADMVLFMHPEYQSSKIVGTIAGKRGSQNGRYIYTMNDPRYIAKSKGLPDFIDMGDSPEEAYSNFMKARRAKAT